MNGLAECYEKIRSGSCTKEEIEAFAKTVKETLGECAMLVQSLVSFATVILNDSHYVKNLARLGQADDDKISIAEMSSTIDSIIGDIESKSSNYLEALAFASMATARMMVIYDGRVRMSLADVGISAQIPMIAEIGTMDN